MKKISLFVLLSSFISVVFGQVPAITSFSPTSGMAGTTVTITGKNFNAAADKNGVLLNGLKAPVVTASATQLTVTIPTGTSYGAFTVANKDNALTGTSKALFLTMPDKAIPIGTPIDFEDEQILVKHYDWGFLNPHAVADIDGDGQLDIVVSDDATTDIIIFRNTTATGSTTPVFTRVNIGFGIAGRFLKAEDINGDGKPDIIITTTDRMFILVNNAAPGTITDASFGMVSVTLTTPPLKLFTGDADGDGRIDIITTGENKFTVYPNSSVNGIINATSFATKVNVVIPDMLYLQVADMNVDGKVDIIAVRTINFESKKIDIYRNTATPGNLKSSSFVSAVNLLPAKHPRAVFAKDINGDGLPELIQGNFENDEISIFQNKTVAGSATIALGASINIPMLASVVSVEVGDFDGNGKPDVYAISDQTPSYITLIRNTNATATLALSGFATKNTYSFPTRGADVSVGDVDGNGRPDLVYGDKQLVIALNSPSAPPKITSLEIPDSTSAGDLIEIYGDGFSTNIAENQVFFGTIKTEVTEAYQTRLSVKVPNGGGYEPVTVLNKTKGLAAVSSRPFSAKFSSRYDLAVNDFAAPFNLAGGGKPLATVAADIDGNGKPDLVVLNGTGNSLIIYRNIGAKGKLAAASFAAGVTFATGTNPSSVIVKDLNNDGKADIAVANAGSNTVSVFINKAVSGNITAASLAAKVDFTVGTNPVKIASADIDGDGHADLLTANNTAKSFSVLRNTGTGTDLAFAAKVDIITPGKPSAIATGDFDNDDKPDVVVTNGDINSASIFENKAVAGAISASSFAAAFTMATGNNPVDIALGRLMNGYNIVVANKGSNTVSVFYGNNYYNHLQFEPRFDLATGTAPAAVKVADMDGDGYLDIAVANSGGNNISLYRNLYNWTDDDEVLKFAEKVDLATGTLPLALTICDFDEDTRPDIVVAKGDSNNLSIFRNSYTNIAPTITSFTPQSGALGTEVTINGTNFNADPLKNSVFFGAVKATVVQATSKKLVVTVPAGANYQPITVTNTDRNSTAWTQKPFVVTFTNPQNSTYTDFDDPVYIYASTAGHRVRVSDLNGDGKPDILVSPDHVDLTALFRNVSKPGSLTSLAFRTSYNNPSLTIGETAKIIDIDADGKPDIFDLEKGVCHINITNWGVDTIASFKIQDIIFRYSIYDYILADVTADGKPDILTFGDGVMIFHNVSSKGIIRFEHLKNIPLTNTAGAALAVTDINGDLKPDLVITRKGTNYVSVLLNISTGQSPVFAAKIDVPTGTLGASPAAFADLDGDGKPDMIVGNLASNSVSFLRNTYTEGSNNLFAAKVDFALSGNPTSANLADVRVALGDITGDGKPDIIATLRDTYAWEKTVINYIINKSTPANFTAASFVAGEKLGKRGSIKNWPELSDLDGDSKPDLFYA
ncbi:MAG: FG-GAP-like repeat-containing protein [Mucilaginibacter sp.]